MTGVRPNTQRTYSAAQSQYLSFCKLYNLLSIPATETVLLRYVAHLSEKPGRSKQGLSASTIHVYLSSVRALQIGLGYPPPPLNAPRVQLAVRAVALRNPPPVQKLPITFPILVVMVHKLSGRLDASLWKAVLSLAFFCCLWGSELSAVYSFPSGGTLLVEPPLVGAVAFGVTSGTPYYRYTVLRSKTSRCGFSCVAGCVGQQVCPVCYMREYQGNWI